MRMQTKEAILGLLKGIRAELCSIKKSLASTSVLLAAALKQLAILATLLQAAVLNKLHVVMAADLAAVLN